MGDQGEEQDRSTSVSRSADPLISRLIVPCCVLALPFGQSPVVNPSKFIFVSVIRSYVNPFHLQATFASPDYYVVGYVLGARESR